MRRKRDKFQILAQYIVEPIRPGLIKVANVVNLVRVIPGNKMSFSIRAIALLTTGFLLSSTPVFAQVGGSDIPSDAKAVGTMENGPSSTGMSRREAKQRMDAMKMKKGTMSKGQM